MKSDRAFWNLVGFMVGVSAVILGILLIVVKMQWKIGIPAMDGPFVLVDESDVPDLYHAICSLGYAVTQLYKLIANLAGISFVFLGAVGICVFQCRLAALEKDDGADDEDDEEK